MPDNPTDPFTAFWSDWMSKMGMSPPSSSGIPEPLKQVRQACFDAMAQYADQFMRSEQFLSAMKQSMDNALAFRQQMDQFLTQNVRNMQAPARSDTDHILLVLRSMEERVLGRLEKLDQRVAALEREPFHEQTEDAGSSRMRAPEAQVPAGTKAPRSGDGSGRNPGDAR